MRLATARRVAALVLLVDLEQSPLAVPGSAKRTACSRPAVPRATASSGSTARRGRGNRRCSPIALGDRVASGLRLIFQGAGPPLRVSEVFVYGPDEDTIPVADQSEDAPGVRALAAARRGDWDEAARLYAEAVRQDADRASRHAALARASWRAAHRGRIDVESLDDGGPDLVVPAR